MLAVVQCVLSKRLSLPSAETVSSFVCLCYHSNTGEVLCKVLCKHMVAFVASTDEVVFIHVPRSVDEGLRNWSLSTAKKLCFGVICDYSCLQLKNVDK